MAKVNNTQEQYTGLMRDIKAGNFAPVYLLMGDESYYIDKVCSAITAGALTESEKDFNLIVYHGADTTAQAVCDQAHRFPMMASRMVIVVREAQALNDFDVFEKYLAKPVQTTLLVVCYAGKLDARKKVTTLFGAAGRVLVSEAPRYDRDIIAFINAYLRDECHGATIDPKAAAVVAANIGSNLKRLTSELDKALIGLNDEKARRITPDIVEQKIGISKEFNVFEFRDALVQRDAMRVWRIAKYFNSNPKAGGLFALLPQVFSFFQNLMIAHYIPKPASDSAIMAQLGLRSPYQVRDYATGMRNFNARRTLDIIAKIREVDARSKGLDNVSTPPEQLLQELITFILH